MSKYDWSNVPKEVKWIATDADKVQVEFINKPHILHEHRMWVDDTEDGYHGFSHTDKLSDFTGNWQDSLEERPK